MKKRILALALVASMCVSLAACGNSGSKGTTEQQKAVLQLHLRQQHPARQKQKEIRLKVVH